MKRLINEEEVNLASRENANNMYGRKNGEHQYFNASVSDFNAGVIFTEGKLKDLIIEFNCWCWSNHISPCGDGTYYDALSNICYASDSIVFEKFLSARL